MRRLKLTLKQYLSCYCLVVMAFCLVVNSLVLASSELETDLQTMLPQECRFSGAFEQSKETRQSPPAEYSNGIVLFDCKLGLIWETQQPSAETQILTLTGIHYAVKRDNKIARLRGIAEGLRAKLLLSLLTSDVEFINKHFTIEAGASQTLVLLPNTKTYQRGLESVVMTQPETAENAIEITIKDKKSLTTTITLIQELVMSTADEFQDSCNAFYLDGQYCDVLNNPKDYRAPIR